MSAFLTEIDLSASDHASPAIGHVTAQLGGLASILAELSGVELGDFGISKVLKEGANSIRLIQGLQQALAGQINAFASLKAGGEELAQGIERVARANREAADQIERVIGIANRLNLAQEATVAAYNRSFEALTRLGGTSKQQVQFFDTLAKASRVLGISLDDAASALSRMVATGTLSNRDPLGRALSGLGVSSQQLKEFIASGDGLEKLGAQIGKLAAGSKAAEPTFNQALQGMKNALEDLGEAGARGPLTAIRKQLLDFAKEIKSDSSFRESFGRIGANLSELAEKLAPLLKSVFRFLIEGAEAASAAATKLSPLIGIFTSMVDAARNVISLWKEWTPLILGATGALTAFTIAAKAAAAASALPGLGGLAKAGALGGLGARAIPVVGAGIIGGAAATNLLGELFQKPLEGKADLSYVKAKDAFLNLIAQVETKTKDPKLIGEIRAFWTEVFAGPASEEALAKGKARLDELRAAVSGAVGGEAGFGSKEGGIPTELLEQVKQKIGDIQKAVTAAGASGPLTEKLFGAKADLQGRLADLKQAGISLYSNNAEVQKLVGLIQRLYSLQIAKIIREMAEETEKLRAKNEALRAEIEGAHLEGPAKEYAQAMAQAALATADLDIQIKKLGDDLAAATKKDRGFTDSPLGKAAVDQLAVVMEQRQLVLQKGFAIEDEIIRKYTKDLSEEGFKNQVSALRDDGRDYLAAWEELNHGLEERLRVFEQLIKQAEEAGNTKGVKKLTDGMNKFIASQKEQATRTLTLSNAETAAIVGNWTEAWETISALPTKNLGQYRANLAAYGALLEKFGTSTSTGVARAFVDILKAVKSDAEIAYDAVKGLSEDLSGALRSGLFAAIKGDGDALKQVFDNLMDSILKRVTDALADIIEQWLATVLTIKKNPIPDTGGGGGEAGDWSAGEGVTSAKSGGGGSAAAGWAGVAVGVGTGVSAALKDRKQDVSYKGVNLGKQDFGGPGFGASFAPWATAAIAALAVPVLGWVAAAIIAVVGIIVSLFSGAKEGHVKIGIKEALSKAGGPLGTFVKNVVEGTAAFVGDLAIKAGDPTRLKTFFADFDKRFKAQYGTAVFDIAAGSTEDIQKDIDNFFQNVLPKLSLQAAFGQIGFGPSGNRDTPGGVGGLDWNTLNPDMDKEGNWVKKQLYDPDAPIPLMLTGLGFTADAIEAIALKLSNTTDINKFKSDLLRLVGVVALFNDFQKELAKTTSERFDTIREQRDTSPVAQARKAADDLLNLGDQLELLVGDDRLAKAEALQEAIGKFLESANAALADILNRIEAIRESTKQEIESARDSLLSPGQREAAARTRADLAAANIELAKTPAEISEAYSEVQKQLALVLDTIVARILRIKDIQAQFADFRETMGKAGKATFAEDPRTWLAESSVAIAAVEKALSTAVGDDAANGAARLLSLEKERYANLIDLAGRLKSITASINESIDAQVFDLGLSKLSPHDQGNALFAEVQRLQEQLPGAKTPEEVQRITAQISALVGRLAGQEQDPAKFGESRDILTKILEATREAANKALANMDALVTNELGTIGDHLKVGEEALAEALAAAQLDFEDTIKKLTAAETLATDGLTAFADGITAVLNSLEEFVIRLNKLFTEDAGTADPPVVPVQPGPGGHGPDGPDTGPRGGPRGNLAIEVTVNSETPEEVARAAANAVADAVYADTVDLVRRNNVELLRAVRANRSLAGA